MKTFRIVSTLLLAAVACRAQYVDSTLVAAPGFKTVAPGVTIPALMFNGQIPGPTLAGTVGQTLRVRVVNQLSALTSVHWHGLKIPAAVDGVVGISRPAIAPGQELIYELPLTHPGTYWYHPHVEEQLTSGLYGAIVVHPADPAADPAFDADHTVMLHDDTSYAGGFVGGPMGAPGMEGHFLNGLTSTGQVPVVVNAGQTLRLRIVNAAARQSYVVALDGHPLVVTHADGHRVQPVTVGAVPIGPGERYDALVTLSNPGTWSLAVANISNRNATLVRGIVQYAGSTVGVPAAGYVPPNLSTGTLLSYAQLAAFAPSATLGTPDRLHSLLLGSTMGPGGVSFTINGEAWPNVTPLDAAAGERIQLDFVNTLPAMMNSFLHPMHVHGHFLLLMGTAGGAAAPPVKDTILVRPVGQPGSAASAQLLADNPGKWPVHCHDAHHMALGMMTVLAYAGDADGDGLPDASDWNPTSATPGLAIPELASAFQPGGAGALSAQRPAGSVVEFFAGVPAAMPVPLPPFGTLALDFPPLHLGAAVAGPSDVAELPYALPAGAGFGGLRVGIQAVTLTPFAPGLLLSEWQPMTLY